MYITPENAIRKLDSQGRVIIPKGIRDRMQIDIGDEIEFFTITSGADNFIGLRAAVQGSPSQNYAIAAQVLSELGLSIPERLSRKLNKGQ